MPTAKLSHGTTWYEDSGDSDSNHTSSVTILIHGLVGSSSYFLPLIQHLRQIETARNESCAGIPKERKEVNARCDKGHRRVLALDLYGRGSSAITKSYATDSEGDVAHTVELFVGQVAELLYTLDIRQPVDIVGYSMGGAIAAAFASTFPAKARSLTVIAPAGTLATSIPLWIRVACAIFPFNILRVIARLKMINPEGMIDSKGWENADGPVYQHFAMIQAKRYVTS